MGKADILLEQQFPMRMTIRHSARDKDYVLFNVLYSLNDMYEVLNQGMFLPVILETMGQCVEYTLRMKNNTKTRYYLSGVDNIRVYEDLETYTVFSFQVKVMPVQSFKDFFKNKADLYFSDILICSGDFTHFRKFGE